MPLLGLLSMAETLELMGGTQRPAGGTGLGPESPDAHRSWDPLWVTLRNWLEQGSTEHNGVSALLDQAGEH